MRIAYRSESAIKTLKSPVAKSLLLCAVLSLAACGGGGSDDEVANIDPAAPVPPVVHPDPDPDPDLDPDPNPEFTLGETLISPAPAGAAFYLPPSPLPGSNGDVLWATEIASASNGRLWKVLYRSESHDGTPIAVSGWLAVPTHRARPADGYPIVAFAHGTTGLADNCAPTRRSTPLETIALLEDFLARGFVVAATDYEGLGTPGLHQYLVGPSESHSVLDSARAAQRFGGGSDELILFGHSQGGHAVILANEMATSYAPELKVLGTIGSGSGVFSASRDILDHMKSSPYKGYLVMVALGLEAAYGPSASPSSRWLTEEGIAASDFLKIDEGVGNCVGEVITTFAALTGDYLFVPNAPQPTLATDLDSIPGLVKGVSPLLMIHGKDDAQLPPSVIVPWVVDTCDKTGQVIHLEWFDTGHRVPYENPEAAAAVIFPWIDARFAGRSAPNNCDAVALP